MTKIFHHLLFDPEINQNIQQIRIGLALKMPDIRQNQLLVSSSSQYSAALRICGIKIDPPTTSATEQAS
jgi:hypothetical protein